MGDGGEILRRAHVGAAEHADFAVRIGQCRGPLDGVVAVVSFIFEGIPFAFGGVSAADVLSDDDVAAGGGFQAKIHFAGFVIGRAHQQHGKFSFDFGAVNIGAQGDPVAHFGGDIAFHSDFVFFGGFARRATETKVEA